MKTLLITLPCYNEELVLPQTTATLLAYAEAHFTGRYNWRLLILDNNSHDRTNELARSLAAEHPGQIIVDQVPTPGRGAALRESWTRQTGYDVYSYMDVDLATNLKDFQFLVDQVAAGDDFVTGSRYLPNSDAERSPLRLFLSQTYNWLLKLLLRVSFQDAQCGFKAFSQRLVRELVPRTTDNGWFWDTELMILACRRGYRVREIPVSWREVREVARRSTVAPLTEMFRQLKNIAIMRRRLASNYYEASR